MNQPRKSLYRAKQRGTSMMEVLIALLVVAIGLLGLASLQARGLKFNHDAYIRSQATTLSYEIVERMRARKTPRSLFAAFPDPALQLYTNAPPDPALNDCDPTASTVPDELLCWIEGIQDVLPAGNGNIAIAADNRHYVIQITWTDRETNTPLTQSWTVWP